MWPHYPDPESSNPKEREMPISVHDTSDQREPGSIIPDGTFVHLRMTFRPGKVDLQFDPQQGQIDAGLFWRGKNWSDGDVTGLDCEFTVQDGPYSKQKMWQYLWVAGGELDAAGESKGWQVTRRQLCGMMNSAAALNPKDESPQARAIRTFDAFRKLDGIDFWARVGVQEGSEVAGRPGEFYPDKNTIAHIVEPGDAEYAPLRQGQQVEPQPRGARRSRRTSGNGSSIGSGVASAGPAWSQGSQPAPQPPAQPPAQPNGSYQPAPAYQSPSPPANGPAPGAWGGASPVQSGVWNGQATPPAQPIAAPTWRPPAQPGSNGGWPQQQSPAPPAQQAPPAADPNAAPMPSWLVK